MMRPPKSVVPAFASTGTSISKPAANAVRPVPPSRYSGSSTLMLKLPIMAMVVSTTDGQNARLFMGVRSMSGCSQRSWRNTNSTAVTTATASDPTASATSMVSSTRPRLSAHRNTAESTVDGMSR